MKAVVFGRMVSSQIKSSKEVANFWLINRFRWGSRWCMMVGKYPKRVENLEESDGYIYFKFCVLRLILNASTKPKVVTARAVNFKCRGMAIRGMVVGGMVLEMRKPAKILPINRLLMELIKRGLFLK